MKDGLMRVGYRYNQTTTNLMKISNILPRPKDVYAVFGLTTLFIYGWGLNAFFWILPSWLNFLNIPEIIGVLSYNFITNFLESLTVLFIYIILAAVLPQSYFRNDFLFRAGLSTIWVAILFIFLQINKPLFFETPWILLIWMSLMLLSQIYLGRILLARRVIESITERASIFLYVFIPLSGIAFIVLILRNLQE